MFLHFIVLAGLDMIIGNLARKDLDVGSFPSFLSDIVLTLSNYHPVSSSSLTVDSIQYTGVI
jgi:hypothetical protein